MSLVIDQDVLDFYKENAHLDFNAMNRVFIGILKMLSTNIMDTIDQYSIQKLVGVVDELKRDIVEIKTNHSQLILKMYDIKKEYLDDLRTALKTSENNSQQQIGCFHISTHYFYNFLKSRSISGKYIHEPHRYYNKDKYQK